jgi:hypothetical protein
MDEEVLVQERGVLSEHEMSVLSATLDTLLPGGAGYPPASATGIAAFLVRAAGPEAVDTALRLGLADLDTMAGGDFLALDSTGRTETLKLAEAEKTTFFTWLLRLAYLSYYAQPEVIAAIQADGHNYHQTPLPDGYQMDPFDPANPEMLPVQPRGRYMKTLEIVRLQGVGQ